MLLGEGLLTAAGVALASSWGLFLSTLLKDQRICEAEHSALCPPAQTSTSWSSGSSAILFMVAGAGEEAEVAALSSHL